MRCDECQGSGKIALLTSVSKCNKCNGCGTLPDYPVIDFSAIEPQPLAAEDMARYAGKVNGSRWGIPERFMMELDGIGRKGATRDRQIAWVRSEVDGLQKLKPVDDLGPFLPGDVLYVDGKQFGFVTATSIGRDDDLEPIKLTFSGVVA